MPADALSYGKGVGEKDEIEPKHGGIRGLRKKKK